MLTDLLNFGAEQQMHCAFVAVHEFLRAHGRMPAPNSEAETAQVECGEGRELMDVVMGDG